MRNPPSLEAALAAVRAGRAVRIEPGPTILSVETGTSAMLALLDPRGSARLLISGERAAALGMANEAAAAVPGRPVLIARTEWFDFASARSVVDPGQDFARGPTGPLVPEALTDEAGAEAALALVRHAGLLPAAWVLDGADENALAVARSSITEARAEAIIVARAALPVDGVAACQIVAFRDSATGDEHVALVFGSFAGKPPLVRLHSECLTGDVFGSLKCDCGPQLRGALDLLSAAESGVLLYLRQEGRGIGLANKIRAYALQDRGLDTVDANRRLGFSDDSRDYGMAAAMLRALGVAEVRLLTNNPTKLAGLEAAGIRVVERVAHQMPANPHNADYLATKRTRSGHLA